MPTIPGFEFRELLGVGGMGAVYLARHCKLGRLVAVKVIRAGKVSPQQRARFDIEAETLASLQHPHIVQIHEVGEHQLQPYLCLEFVEGGSLRDHLTTLRSDPRRIAELIEQLARAMHAAHSRGIVHRDLKPDNVLVTKDGLPKVTDFGLAKRLADPQAQTVAGVILGTPSYMAPEQTYGLPNEIGPAADTYALGVILYEMLTGQVPFRGESAAVTLQLIQTSDAAPPARLAPGVPRDLETICLKCLEKDRSKRYASAEALAEDLRRFRQLEPIQARPVTRLERLGKWARRRPAAAALVVVSAVALLAMAGQGWWTHRQLRVSAERAENRLRLARKVLDDMYVKVAEDWLAEQPQHDPLQRAFLEEAQKVYEIFVKEEETNPELRRAQAVALFRVGQIQRTLGQSAEALQAYAQAIALQTDLRQSRPNDAALAQELAESHHWRGELHRDSRHDLPAAEADLRVALRLRKEAVQREARQLESARDLARTHYNLGIVQMDARASAAAEGSFNNAVALLQPLHEVHPQEPTVRQELARTHINRGILFKLAQRWDAAEQDYRTAAALLDDAELLRRKASCRCDLAVTRQNLGNLLLSRQRLPAAQRELADARRLLEALTEDFPTRPGYRKKLASTCNSLGTVFAQDRQLADAADAWKHAQRLLARLVAEDANVPDYHLQLGIVLGNRAWLSSLEKDHQASRTWAVQAIGELRATLRLQADNHEARAMLRNQLQTLAEACLGTKDHAAAAQAAQDLIAVIERQPQDHYHAACFLARAAELASPAEGASAFRYRNLAIANLTQVIELATGNTPIVRLTNEAQVFRSLESMPELPKILEKLAKSQR